MTSAVVVALKKCCNVRLTISSVSGNLTPGIICGMAGTNSEPSSLLIPIITGTLAA